jgi:hypothetical protein
MTKQTQKDLMLATLGKLSNAGGEKVPEPVRQKVSKVEAPKKVGRKNHRMEGVEYARLSPAIPMELKLEMEVAMRTTHKAYPTIDTFITHAVQALLASKK